MIEIEVSRFKAPETDFDTVSHFTFSEVAICALLSIAIMPRYILHDSWISLLSRIYDQLRPKKVTATDMTVLVG